MDQIKKLTFEAACKMRKLEPKKVVPGFEHLPVKERKAMRAHLMIVIMVAAANQIANGGKAYHKNPDQVKYEARWYHDGGSSGFRFDGFAYWCSHSSVGSRLCFISYDCMIALCQGNKEFIKLWNQYAL